MGTMRLFSSNSCLLSELAQLFLARNSQDFSRDLVILPTQRLATKFLASLASALGAFHPPRTHTLESFILEKFTDNTITIGDQTFELLIKMVLKKQQHLKFLRVGHERELRLLFNEMIDSGISETAFLAAKDALRDNIFHSELHLSSVATKIDEIKFVFEHIRNILRQQHMQTKSQRMSHAVTHSQSHQPTAYAAFENRYLVGITSIAESWMPALKTFLESEDAEVWLTEKPRLFHDKAPLGRLIDQLAPGITVTHSSSTCPPTRHSRVLVNADTPFHEVISAYHVAAWYVEQGVSPADIGILQTNEGVYGPIIASLKTNLLKNANLAMTLPVVHSIFGSWLKGLMQVYEDNYSLERVFDWFKNPITNSWLQETFEINIDLLTWTAVQGKYLTFDQFLNSGTIATSFKLQMEEVFSYLKNEESSLVAWLQRFEDLLKVFSFMEHVEPEYRDPLKNLVQEFIHSLSALGDYDSSPLTQAEFFQILDGQFLNQGLRQTGEPLAGVQILNLSESRYYPFQVVFILGCNEGIFPKALPKDELLDNFFKKQMGFLGWEQLEAMEDQTFYLLHSRIPHLILTRCREQSGEITVKSRFIESLSLQGDIRELDSSYHLGMLWEGFETDHQLPTTGDEPEGIWKPHNEIWQNMSASSLKKLISCPYAYLLDRCRVRIFAFQHPADARFEGEWLHKVLQSLFSQIPPCDDPRSFSSWIRNELERLTIALGPDRISEKPLYYQLRFKAWPAFAEHLCRLFGSELHFFRKGLKEVSLEEAIKTSPKIMIRNLERYLVGSIDSIDFNYGISFLADYKRQSIPQRSESTLGLNPQLAFYALALQQGGQQFSFERMLLGYWSILKGEWSTHGVGEQVREKSKQMGLSNSRTPEASSLVERMIKNWEWREKTILQRHRFYADPSRCGLCHYEGICRKNSPDKADIIESQKDLAVYIKGETPC